MKRREFVVCGSGAAVALFTPFRAAGQKKILEPDVGALAGGKRLNGNASGGDFANFTIVPA